MAPSWRSTGSRRSATERHRRISPGPFALRIADPRGVLLDRHRVATSNGVHAFRGIRGGGRPELPTTTERRRGWGRASRSRRSREARTGGKRRPACRPLAPATRCLGQAENEALFHSRSRSPTRDDDGADPMASACRSPAARLPRRLRPEHYASVSLDETELRWSRWRRLGRPRPRTNRKPGCKSDDR
jgi:hypothetical protein